MHSQSSCPHCILSAFIAPRFLPAASQIPLKRRAYDSAMRRLIAILSLGFLLSPALAAAQGTGAPPPDMATPSAQMRAAMQQAREQMKQIHVQARTQMLASLS